MSLINAFNLGDHVLISADTDAVFEDGRHGNVSKLLTIPHANAVIAFRGSMGVLSEAHAQFSVLSDFDEMLRMADLVIQYALARQGKTELTEEYAIGAEMILAGYSKKAGKITINLFRSTGIGEPVEESIDIDIANVIAPGNQAITLDGVTASREGLITLTARQVAHVREKHHGCAAGGLLMIAEVRPCKVTVETVCSL